MDRISIFRSLVDAFPNPCILIGRSERILVTNSGAERIFGRNCEGLHYTSVLRQPQVVDAFERVVSTNTPQEVRFLNKSIAEDHVYRISFQPMSGPSSAGVLATFEDLTREEGLGQMRRDFVANVSHELRSPLTALTGFIETLRGPAAQDKAAHERFLAMMETETARMTRLVQDLLSLSRVESEERIRPDEKVDVSHLLSETQMVLTGVADEKGVQLTITKPDAPIWVTGNRDQLFQVFRNLIENAVKYGTSQVDVSVSLPEREPFVRGPAVVVDVTDDGEGIEPHHVPRLTERFYRVDTHRSRAQGGTGLGLAIVKHVIGRHRGRLRISSVPGQGSTFSVILPRL